MRALVLGADGFVGRWLVRHLAGAGDEVHAVVGARYQAPLSGATGVHQADVRNKAAVAEAVQASLPSAIYYLAGVSQPGQRENLTLALEISVMPPLHLLAAAAELPQPARLLMVGSSHMYTNPDSDLPLDEDAPVGGRTVYGATKAAAEAAAFAVGRAAGVDVIGARPFNHIGPGQTTAFVVPALAGQVAEIAAGLRDGVIRAGSLQARRDFTDVRDVVRAYRLLMEMGEAGTAYNIGSGHAVSIRDVLDRLLAMAGVAATIATDASLLRPNEPPAMVADASRLSRTTGWRPEITLEDSLRDVLNEALTRVGRPAIAGHAG